MSILIDTPITSKDSDRLNRDAFVQIIAEAIVGIKCDDSVCFGLYGPWGSGKTSIMNLIEESIHKYPDVIVFRFNPWLCKEPGQMLSEFFKQFANSLRIQIKTNNELVNLIAGFGFLCSAASSVPVIGGTFSGIADKLKDLRNRILKSDEQDLQRQKDKIIAHLKKTDYRILIMIDDIDRLSYEEIIAVFQLVKSLADFPHTVYLLSFDHDIVVSALNHVQEGSGQEYLEKIVQVPFAIPSVEPYTLETILFKHIDDLIDNIPSARWDKEKWIELYLYGISHYFDSIRSIKRFINVLSLNLSILKDEVDPVDLVGLTCIQIFEPHVYAQLYSMKALITGDNTFYDSDIRKQEAEELKRSIDEIMQPAECINNAQAINVILRVLFPRIRRLKDSWRNEKQYDERASFNNGSISNPSCFDRYFILRLDKDSIPRSSLESIILYDDEGTIRDSLIIYIDDKKVYRLLSGIEMYLSQKSMLLSPERAELLFRILMEHYPVLYTNKSDGVTNIPFKWRFWYCLERVLGCLSVDDRQRCITEAFGNKDIPLKGLTYLLWEFEDMHGRINENEPADENPLITLEQLQQIETEYVKRCKSYTDEYKDNGNADMDYLFMLKRLDHLEFERIIKSYSGNPVSLMNLVSFGTSRGHSILDNNCPIYTFHEEYYDVSLDIESSYKVLLDYSTTDEFLDIPKEKQQDVVAFLIHAEQRNNPDAKSYVTIHQVEDRLDRIVGKKTQSSTY